MRYDDEGGNTATEALGGSDLASIKAENEALRARLAELQGNTISRPVFNGEVPKYKLNSPCYFEDDTLRMEGDIVEYIGTPNLEMVPLNKAAEKRMQEFIGMLTDAARQTAQLHGRPFEGLVTDNGVLIAQNLQHARRTANEVVVAMPVDRSEVPTMPHTEDAAAIRNRGGRPRKASPVISTTPQSSANERPTPKTYAQIGREAI